MKFLFDLFPVILFFVTFKLSGIFAATAVAIAATIVQIGWVWLRHRKVEPMQWISLLIIVVFGGATLLLPLHEMTATYWEAHVGIGRDGRQADCTHFCPSPFMWERFWWALRQHV